MADSMMENTHLSYFKLNLVSLDIPEGAHLCGFVKFPKSQNVIPLPEQIYAPLNNICEILKVRSVPFLRLIAPSRTMDIFPEHIRVNVIHHPLGQGLLPRGIQQEPLHVENEIQGCSWGNTFIKDLGFADVASIKDEVTKIGTLLGIPKVTSCEFVSAEPETSMHIDTGYTAALSSSQGTHGTPMRTRQPPQRIGPDTHPGSTWIDQNRSRLNNNHWVAASNNGLEASSPRLDDVVSQIRKKNLPPDQVTIAFITNDAV